MKLLYLITRGDTIAGAQRNVLDLATAYADDGNEVIVASSGAHGPFAAELERRGLTFRAIESLRPGQSARQQWSVFGDLTELFREFEPDLVHAHSTKAGLIGRIVARRCSTPAVFTAHGWAYTTGIPTARRFVGLLIELVGRLLGAHVITVSEHDYQLGKRAKTTPPKRLHLVEYGIPDLDEAVPPPPTDGVPQLLMAARFEAQKDHETLISALGQITDLDWRMVFAGDGPGLEASQRLAKSLGLSDRIDFLGYEPNVPSVLRQSSALLLITHYEGLPLSILEALRAGRAIVATDVGGIAQMVIPNRTGSLTRPEDVSSVATELRTALTTPGWFTDRSEAAREHYLANFTVGRMVARTSVVYDKAIGGN